MNEREKNNISLAVLLLYFVLTVFAVSKANRVQNQEDRRIHITAALVAGPAYLLSTLFDQKEQ